MNSDKYLLKKGKGMIKFYELGTFLKAGLTTLKFFYEITLIVRFGISWSGSLYENHGCAGAGPVVGSYDF